MILNSGTLKSFYNGLAEKIDRTRSLLGRPLTIAEKILYSHLYDENALRAFKRGHDYVEFRPDRIAMQDATAQMALLQFMMAGRERSAVPASVHCDHLIVARAGSGKDLEEALVTNREVYDFLGSVSRKYGIDFWEPGSGIIHQVVLENYAFPGGLMTGTDSHTVNAGGLGMIAVGVGGADAVDAMAGMGWELKFPRMIGIRLTGRLNGWTSAKDIILRVSGELTVKGGTGSIIEYFGEGARSLSCTGKGTICNMGAEVGATCSIFGYDASMASYLRATSRAEVADLADSAAAHLNGDPQVYEKPELYFDQVLEINLSELEPYINGPFTPDLATPISKMKEAVVKNNWPRKVEVGLIGSCTNSSYEDLSRAASIARDALDKKLAVNSEFTITPGSEQIRLIAERDGFLGIFEKLGAKVFANACGPCIGQWSREGADRKELNTVVHSFNRNFAKRTDGNPNTHAFVASPEIVTALALAGDLTFNPLADTLVNSEGREVKLKEPQGIDLPPGGFRSVGEGLRKPSEGETVTRVIIKDGSDRLQALEPFPAWDGMDFLSLHLLIKSTGKCTTDHISMAGHWLRFRGHLGNISDNYMIGAINYFNKQANLVLNQNSGQYQPVPQVAKTYKAAAEASIVIGEENFGEGSSREHAAMEPRFLNVKVILVKSFARIHETNLKKQGVLALTFNDKADYDRIREEDRIDVKGLAGFAPGEKISLVLHHNDGTSEEIFASHSYNEAQIGWFRAGSALNLIKAQR
jgi:aconitate hydratase